MIHPTRTNLLLLKEKAEVIEAAEERLHAAYTSLPRPLVIRLVYYVRIPHPVALAPSRRTVMARDNYTCQYCGDQPPKANLTITGGTHVPHSPSFHYLLLEWLPVMQSLGFWSKLEMPLAGFYPHHHSSHC